MTTDADLAINALVLAYLAALAIPLAGLCWCIRRVIGGRAPGWFQVVSWIALYVGGVFLIFGAAILTGRHIFLPTREGITRLLSPFDVVDPFVAPAIVIVAVNVFLSFRDRRATPPTLA